MKKTLLSLSCLVVIAGGADALDWGVNVNEVPLTILGQTTLYVESVKARAWLTQPLGGAVFRLEGEGSFSASSTGGRWQLSDPLIDLAEASLKGTTPLGDGGVGVLEWDLGRRSVTDLTGGWILGSRWDGAALAWLQGLSKVSTSAGYSGLLLKKTSRIAASPADASDAGDAKVLNAPRRVYGAAGWSANEVLWRQDLQAEVLGDLDLRSGSGALHGVYATLATTGPLPLGWRQRLHATGSARIAPSSMTLGYLAGGEWSATLPFLGSRLVVNAMASRGLGGHGFQAVSGKGLAEVVSLASSHGALLGSDFSFKPVAKTTLGGKAIALFRTSGDAVALSGFRSASDHWFLGTEAGVYTSWTPTSELAFGANGGVFLPFSGAFEAQTKPTVLIVVTATLKL